MRTAVISPSGDAIPTVNPEVSLIAKDVPAPKSAAGFLLLDSSLSPVFFNAEAVQILSYPDDVAILSLANTNFLSERVRALLQNSRQTHETPFVTEFRSGRRRYFCRTFRITPNGTDPYRASVAVLLERGPSGLVALSKISEQFNLTKREREVLEYLLQGMSSKEIAKRMNVSTSTVKAFLRLIMIKTRVSSRSEIVGKIMMMQT